MFLKFLIILSKEIITYKLLEKLKKEEVINQ